MPQQDLTQGYLAAIVESSEDAILGKDLEGNIRSFNAAAERLFGWSAGEIIGRPVTLLIPPERQREECEILARLRRGERVEHFETVRMAKDGRRIEVSLSVSPVRDACGAVIGAAKILRDVTERNRVARALAAQREWFRVTLASIGDAVVACDAEGRVTFLNAVAERLTGWPGTDAVGQPLADVFHIVHEQTRRRVDNPADTVLREGRTVGLANHTLLIARDGAEWPIADSAAPIVDDDGRTLGVVLVFHEIADQRRHEAALAAAARERETLLAAERIARGEAERANRVKDDFVAMVSHELRTPLSAILGWANVLEEKPDDVALVRHGLEIIGRNAQMQAQLVSDLLDMSRIASEQLRLELERVDLAGVITESIETVQTTADARGVTLHPETPGRALHATGDAARLRQVVWNLLANAVKFTPRGGRVEVILRANPTHAEIAVRDSGMGIRAEDLEGIFDRGRRLGTARRDGGLGLGLSIARHLVELHGGTLRAHSDGEGRGATFTVVLPLDGCPLPLPAGGHGG